MHFKLCLLGSVANYPQNKFFYILLRIVSFGKYLALESTTSVYFDFGFTIPSQLKSIPPYLQ